MTLDELLAWATTTVFSGYGAMKDPTIHPRERRAAQAVIDLLGEARPCGFELPVVDHDMVTILDGSEDPQPAYQFTPAEARWFAAALLRAADEAEAKQ